MVSDGTSTTREATDENTQPNLSQTESRHPGGKSLLGDRACGELADHGVTIVGVDG